MRSVSDRLHARLLAPQLQSMAYAARFEARQIGSGDRFPTGKQTLRLLKSSPKTDTPTTKKRKRCHLLVGLYALLHSLLGRVGRLDMGGGGSLSAFLLRAMSLSENGYAFSFVDIRPMSGNNSNGATVPAKQIKSIAATKLPNRKFSVLKQGIPQVLVLWFHGLRRTVIIKGLRYLV